MEFKKLIIDTDRLDFYFEFDKIIEVLKNLNVEYSRVDDGDGYICYILIEQGNLLEIMWNVIENLDDKYEFNIYATEDGFDLSPKLY